MFKIALQIIVAVRQMFQISGLAITLVKTNKNTENFGNALRTGNSIDEFKLFLIKDTSALFAFIAISLDNTLLKRAVNSNTRILGE